MNDEMVRFTVDLAIHDGKRGEFERIAQAMCEGSQNEPGTVTYSWYLSGDGKRCRLIEVYTDGKAVLGHLTGPVVKELVPRLLQTSKVTGFEVYGDPGPKASELLAGFGADVFKHWRGLSR